MSVSPFRKILVAVDGSRAANRGLREAIRLARGGAPLVILHVVDEFYAFATPAAGAAAVDITPQLRESGRKVLAAAAALAARHEVKAKTILREVVVGGAASAIVREARRQRADLIVLGTHGRRGLRRLVLGSDAEQVVRTATVPVLLVRDG
jgi:nucleotide-binding universal stress UspA family protein